MGWESLRNATIIIQSFDQIIYEHLISNHMFYEESSRRKATWHEDARYQMLARVKEKDKPS